MNLDKEGTGLTPVQDATIDAMLGADMVTYCFMLVFALRNTAVVLVKEGKWRIF